MNAIKDRIHRITAAAEELDAVIVPEVPEWFHESAIRKIRNIRQLFETELVRLDSKLEAELNRAPNRAPNASNLLDIDALRTEIQYLANDVRILEEKAKAEFTQEDFKMAFNNPGLVHLLLANPRINPNDKDLWMKAIEKGQTEVVRLLLPRISPAAGNNAIKVASLMGHTEIVRMLLADPRLDPSVSENYAFTRACTHGHTEVVRLLLADSRVDPAVDGNDAIGQACRHGRTEVVRLLLADSRVDPADEENFAIGGSMSKWTN